LLALQRGIELGHIFKLRTRYSEPLGATFLDRDGKAQPVVMGSYGIGLSRLMAVIAEVYHDEQGLVWPAAIAPADVFIVGLGLQDEEVRVAAEKLYAELQAAGFVVLYDDRDERAGVKFNDADLIGVPARVTVGARALKQGGVEVKLRAREPLEMVPVEALPAYIRQSLGYHI
jgi:prolyl-tRNA synthetase